MTDEGGARALLSWFARHRRPLPGRVDTGRPAPYAVLVSEIMCQQTRVETVIAYYERWMAALPDLAALAAADEDRVIALWAGLGYYRRARNLHLCAQQASARHGGIPADPAALAALAGVGPYTTGAIASLAFGLPAALVDGNVARVLARWFAIDVDVSAGAGRRLVWAHARELLTAPAAAADPGRWNEALMELGALICSPRRPDCGVCPVVGSCAAARQARQDALPVPRKRKAPARVLASYAVIRRGGDVLLGRRPAGGRWPGLREPPGWEGPGAAAALADFLAAHDLPADPAPQRLVHVLTHRRYEVTAHRIDAGPALDVAGSLGLQALGYTDVRWSPVASALGTGSGLSRLAQRVIGSVAAA